MAQGEDGGEAALWRALFISMIHVLNTVEADVKAAADLTLLDLGVLFALAHSDEGRPMGQVASIFGVDASVITYRVKRLEALGYVARTPVASDRRLTHVQATATGLSRLREVRPVMLDSAREHFFSRIDPADLPALTRAFTALHAGQSRDRTGP